MLRSRIGAVILTSGLAAMLAMAGCQRGGTGNTTGSRPNGKLGPEATLSIPTLQGAKTSISQYKGKVVLVNFWATWCEPCQTEIPWLIGFNDKYGPQGLVILGVAMDDEGKKVVEPFVKDRRFNVDGTPKPMDYSILLGNDDIADKFGGLLGLPTSYLYGRDGRKVKTIIGLANRADLMKAIENQLSTLASGD